MFAIEFSHVLFSSGPRQQIPAMNRVKAIITNANFSGHVFAFSKEYAAWETDEVPQLENLRSHHKSKLAVTMRGASQRDITKNRSHPYLSYGTGYFAPFFD